jgi:hypothetical protein
MDQREVGCLDARLRELAHDHAQSQAFILVVVNFQVLPESGTSISTKGMLYKLEGGKKNTAENILCHLHIFIVYEAVTLKTDLFLSTQA